ncbi:MAG: PAS domain S-box protein [Deltaproteobacteria bacterium]|nr:PAS domain S-box protein [Deltaproteobacteria bacterium]
MNDREKRTWEARLEKGRAQGRKLREEMAALKVENRSFQKDLREVHGLLANVPGGLVLVQDGNLLYVNDAVKAQLGYGEERILGRPFTEFVHPDSLEFVSALHKKRLSGGQTPKIYDTYMIAKGGRSVRCEVRVNQIKYRGKRAYLVSLLPVGRRRRRERKTILAQKMEVVTRMAAGLNLEFRRCRKLLEGLPDSKVTVAAALEGSPGKWANKVAKAKRALDTIARQLEVLGTRRVDASKVVVMDLKEVVRDSVSDVRKSLDDGVVKRKGDIQIRTYLRNLSAVKGHPEEIGNAISYMIRNAVDALPGTGEIYVSTEMSSGVAEVYIQDNGAGIPEDMQDRIFDPFFTTRQEMRLGLGLSLAQAAISQNRGEIEVLNHKERGTTFIIRFPVTHSPPPSDQSVKFPRKRIKDARLLIVADESIARDLLVRCLRDKGAVVGSAAVAEGLNLLRKRAYDMVFLGADSDPDRTVEIVSRIRTLRRNMPVALLGGRKAADGCGADMVFTTPLNMELLLKQVRQTLEKGAPS